MASNWLLLISLKHNLFGWAAVGNFRVSTFLSLPCSLTVSEMGVILHSELTFSQHMNLVTQNCYYQLRELPVVCLCLSVCLSVCLSFCLSVCLSVCLSLSLSLSVCLSLSFYLSLMTRSWSSSTPSSLFELTTAVPYLWTFLLGSWGD